MDERDPILNFIRWFVRKPGEAEAASVRRRDRLGKKADELLWAADRVLDDVAEVRRRHAEDRQ